MRKYLYGLATDRIKGFIPGIFKVFLCLLSFIYFLVARVLSAFYRLRPYRLNCKVISVGNITLGGTGKTVLVEFIACYLKEQGHKVAILSRGYKRKGFRFSVFGSRSSSENRAPSAETMGDEPCMLAQNLGDIPIIVDPDRIRAAKKAIGDFGVDAVILDDGYQQWKIKKDLEIVVVDALNPFGNGHLIPRGILREPLFALKRADIFILTKVDLCLEIRAVKDVLDKINPRALLFESRHNPVGFYLIGKEDQFLPLDQLKGKSVSLFSGIGDPDSFENLIKSLGINVGLSFKFPDHHHYLQSELEDIMHESKRKNIDTVITTEKDAARLLSLPVTRYPLPVLALRVELKIINDEQRFRSRLLSLYSI